MPSELEPPKNPLVNQDDDGIKKPFESPSGSSFSAEENEEFLQRIDPRKLFLGIQRHTWVILLSMLIFGGLGAIGSYHYLKTYKAESAVLYHEDMPKTLAGGYVLNNLSLSTVLDSIKLSNNLQAVKSILGLDLPISKLEEMVEVPPPKNNSNLIRIVVRGDQTNLVVDIANTLARVVAKNSQDFYQKQLQLALDNFKNELEIMKQRLTTQVHDIEEFKKTHQYFEMTGEYTGLINQLNDLKSKYENASLQYNRMLVEYENLNREVNSLPDTKPVSTMATNSALQTRVFGLQSALAEARAKYSSENPKIKLLESELNDLLKQIKSQEGSASEKEIVVPNEEKEKMKLELMRMEGKVRGSQKVKEELGNSLGQMEKRLETLPSQQMSFSKLLKAKQITEDEIKFLNNAVESTQLMINVPKGSLEFYHAAEKATPLKNALWVYLLPIVGLIFGLIFGLVIALLLEVRDTSIVTAKQVELAYHLPCLQIIPELSFLSKKNAEEKTLYFIRNLSERIEQITRSSGFSKKALSIAFTSSIEGEGKSLFAYHFALYQQRLGKKVVFLNFDYHKNQFLEGLSTTLPRVDVYLRGGASINDIIIQGKPDTVMIDSPILGMKELVKSSNMNRLWEKLQNEYEVIVIDAPGIIQDDYAPNIVAFANYCVFVIGSTMVSKNLVDESFKELGVYGVKPCGIVLNHVPAIYIEDEKLRLENKRKRRQFWKKLFFIKNH